jgi:hypothetical protein
MRTLFDNVSHKQLGQDEATANPPRPAETYVAFVPRKRTRKSICYRIRIYFNLIVSIERRMNNSSKDVSLTKLGALSDSDALNDLICKSDHLHRYG